MLEAERILNAFDDLIKRFKVWYKVFWLKRFLAFFTFALVGIKFKIGDSIVDRCGSFYKENAKDYLNEEGGLLWSWNWGLIGTRNKTWKFPLLLLIYWLSFHSFYALYRWQCKSMQHAEGLDVDFTFAYSDRFETTFWIYLSLLVRLSVFSFCFLVLIFDQIWYTDVFLDPRTNANKDRSLRIIFSFTSHVTLFLKQSICE